MATNSAKTKPEQEKILGEFQMLRNDQRNLANQLNTMEMELKEHKTVIETLKIVDENRKCFRLIGGVLCERTVKDVLPQLIENKNMLEKAIETASKQLSQKGIQINKFKEEHNITIRAQEPLGGDGDSKSSKANESGQENRNILVAN